MIKRATCTWITFHRSTWIINLSFQAHWLIRPMPSCKNPTPSFILQHVSHREYTELTMYEGSDAPLGKKGIHSRDPPDLGQDWIRKFSFLEIWRNICILLLSSCHTLMCCIKCFLWPCMSCLTFSKQPQHLHNDIAPLFTCFLPSLTQHLCEGWWRPPQWS